MSPLSSSLSGWILSLSLLSSQKLSVGFWVAPNITQYLKKVTFFPFAPFVSLLTVFYVLFLVLSVSTLAVLLWAMSIFPLSACTLPAYYPLSVITQHTTSQHNLPINRRNMSHTWLSLPQLFSPLRKIQLVVLQIAGICYSLPL